MKQNNQTQKPLLQLTQTGFMQHPVIIMILVIVALYGGFQLLTSHAVAETTIIRSGVSGYCLDVHDDSTVASAVVDSWHCNNSSAQSWKFAGANLVHHGNDCLSVQNNSMAIGAVVVANTCEAAPGQIWLQTASGYENPNSGHCLAIPDSNTGTQLALEDCRDLSHPNETWTYTAAGTTNNKNIAVNCALLTDKGQKVACFAEQNWAAWQSKSSNHNSLLNSYTNGYGYEEWCADFVSYVYKQAGYPFTGGESDGWDENIASNIQNMGFSEHDAGSYIPKTGDVAFFNYPGGHVEIVASGGPKPTFIYGDSATTDPSTGSGDMASNALTQDALGQVTYYLSPN